MSDGPRESLIGRAWVLGTVVVLFLAPIWAMLAAGVVQVFPEFVGYEILWDGDASRRVFTTRSWLIAGTAAFAVEAAFVVVLSFVGGGTLVARLFGRLKDRSDRQRYQDLAGDVVVSGVELKTTTVVATEEDAPQESGAELRTVSPLQSVSAKDLGNRNGTSD
jgi:hypothetical protein